MGASLLRDGYIRIVEAIDPEFCDEVVDRVLRREAISDVDPATWGATPRHCPVVENWDLAQVAPAAAAAVAELVGGDEAIAFAGVQDNLIVNFPCGEAWHPPSTREGNWHKDGDWFRHFIDSPEQALLVIVFWRDVTDRQGPTIAAVDSIAPVARLLAAHPEGLDPSALRPETDAIVARCSDVRPLTGKRGTVVLAHPFLLHTASPNTTNSLRIISNSSVMLHEPMRFDRTDRPHSPLEQSILDALEVSRLDYEPTGERRRIVTGREIRWRRETADRRAGGRAERRADRREGER